MNGFRLVQPIDQPIDLSWDHSRSSQWFLSVVEAKTK
jgi:hypothetical protein